jgi:hypothetical protein
MSNVRELSPAWFSYDEEDDEDVIEGAVPSGSEENKKPDATDLVFIAEHPPNPGKEFDSRTAVYPKDGVSFKPGHKRNPYRYPVWNGATGKWRYYTQAMINKRRMREASRSAGSNSEVTQRTVLGQGRATRKRRNRKPLNRSLRQSEQADSDELAFTPAQLGNYTSFFLSKKKF